MKSFAGLVIRCLLVFGAAGLSSVVRAATYYVTVDGVDDGGRDGLSWATSFASVHYAAVTRASAGDTVVVPFNRR